MPIERIFSLIFRLSFIREGSSTKSLKGKIFGEANSAVMSMSSLLTWFDGKGRKMMGAGCVYTPGVTCSNNSCLSIDRPHWHRSGMSLDEFTRVTGYYRKSAIRDAQRTALHAGGSYTPVPIQKHLQEGQLLHVSERRTASCQRGSSFPIEQAIQDYLQAQRRDGRRPKTLEWYQTALCLLQEYLLTECHYVLILQITEAAIQSWLTFLCVRPTVVLQE